MTEEIKSVGEDTLSLTLQEGPSLDKNRQQFLRMFAVSKAESARSRSGSELPETVHND